jgi:uncharacterized membrane protein YgdD (TMEM256/DUF423 family)
VNRRVVQIACLLGFLAVGLGAFGAHALQDREGFNKPIWETAVHYQMFHAVALLFAGLASEVFGLKYRSAVTLCFAGGCVVFSGSLYALAVTGIRVLGAITPIGGVLFLLGWILLAISIGGKADA